MAFTIEPVPWHVVARFCSEFHGYGSAGCVMTYAFAVIEAGRPVAVYGWNPPPPGAAKNICPEEPTAVLALCRMAARPKSERVLKHVSKPLRQQMKHLLDRSRWPVLVTYSDEGQGHTGYVYQCSGWQKTSRRRVPCYEDAFGRRVSNYSAGQTGGRELVRMGSTWLQRWEHRACPEGETGAWMAAQGWRRVPSDYVWKSGNRGYRWVRTSDPDFWLS